MVKEELIDTQVERTTSDAERVLLAFRQMQPALYAYLMSEQFALLTEREREFLLFMSLVIWSSLREAGCNNVASERDIGEQEERNWEVWQAAGVARPFRHRMDVFFENYPEEDLLSYIEDSLLIEDDEENEFGVTAEGRELLLISLKTVLDVLMCHS